MNENLLKVIRNGYKTLETIEEIKLLATIERQLDREVDRAYRELATRNQLKFEWE